MAHSTNVIFQPNSTQISIMKLVHGYMKKYKKQWNIMDQKWILKSLKDFYGLTLSRSALNYNLAILRAEGIIETVKRHKRDEVTGAFVCRPTLYRMTTKLKKFFNDLAVYFKRCGWTPSQKQMAMGIVGTVGAVTSRDAAQRAVLDERKRRAVQARRRIR